MRNQNFDFSQFSVSDHGPGHEGSTTKLPVRGILCDVYVHPFTLLKISVGNHR
jgi:hypothetical protein